MDSLTTQPIMCSWDEFKQMAQLTGIKELKHLRSSVQDIGNWQSLCRNLGMSEGDIARITTERYSEVLKKDDCLKSYFNSNEAYWEKVIIAVARPPFRYKQLAVTIAERYLKHSPNMDRILTMIKKCDIITV